jgi:hypothetical protein
MMKEARLPVATGVYIASDGILEASQIAHLGLVRVETRWQTPTMDSVGTTSTREVNQKIDPTWL